MIPALRKPNSSLCFLCTLWRESPATSSRLTLGLRRRQEPVQRPQEPVQWQQEPVQRPQEPVQPPQGPVQQPQQPPQQWAQTQAEPQARP